MNAAFPVASVANNQVLFSGTNTPVSTLVDYLVRGKNIHEFTHDFPEVDGQQAIRVLEAFAASFSHTVLSESQLQQRIWEMELIHETGTQVTSTFDQGHINEQVHTTIARLMSCDSFVISSYDLSEKLIRAEYIFMKVRLLMLRCYRRCPSTLIARPTRDGERRGKLSALENRFVSVATLTILSALNQVTTTTKAR
jgi:hypothetical protein